MSLSRDASSDSVAPQNVIDANRTSDALTLPPGNDLAAQATTMGEPADSVSVARLSPRFPWIDGVGALYAFNASRWDTPAELVYCIPNQVPAGAGWDGTVLYVDFTAPAAGDYTIVATFHGKNSIAHLRGPWGTVSKNMPSGLEMDVVTANWSGSGTILFTLTFSGEWLSAISSVQLFAVT